MGPAKTIPVLLALSPGSCSRCTCSATEGIGAVGDIGGEEEEAMIMAGRAEDGPTRGREACRGPREERSGRARNLMMEWFYFIVRLRLESELGERSDRPTGLAPSLARQDLKTQDKTRSCLATPVLQDRQDLVCTSKTACTRRGRSRSVWLVFFFPPKSNWYKY